MATCIHSSRSCPLPFYTIPIFPLLNRKIFHLLVSFLFFAAHCILALRNILPEAICCCLQTCNVDVVLLVMYCMYIPCLSLVLI